MFQHVCVSVVFYLLLAGAAAQVHKEKSLNGDGWFIQDSGGRLKEPISATVPGQVHLDLLRAGIIKEPYADWNDWLYQWIGYSNWTYDGQLTVESQDMGQVMWLKCDGLDTIATISVNGHVVGHAENYHRRYRFDISDAVKVGTNAIKIEFQSGANYSSAQAAAYPYDLYTDIQGIFFNYSQRGFIRKTQSDFGWDWGPGFAPCGIWGNISVVIVNGLYLSDVVLRTMYDEKSKSYSLVVTTCVEAARQPLRPYVVQSNSKADVLKAEETALFNITSMGVTCHTYVGMETAESTLRSAGNLWWPLGVSWANGTASLTEITTSVNFMQPPSDVVVHLETVVKKVGFRSVELVQDMVGANESDGLTFYFQMRTADQTYPFYAKGSNFIPMNAFVNRVTHEHAQRLLTAFVEGNQNMLRVWGGGLYQPDWFYDMCDEMGIMVWQEFMFADALYPRTGEFLANVKAEIRDVVRRLAHHPSIVLWSGNNENQGILGDNDVWLVDYTVLYDEIVRTTLWEEDTTRIYWPSSPSNGVLVDDKDTQMFIQRWGDVANPKFGDYHRYDYNDFCLDVSKFPPARFVSEFGFQSYPSSTSMKNISQSVDWTNDSPFMVHRNHHPTGNKQMENLASMIFNLPVNDNSEYKFLDFVYLSQVTQGLCIRAQAEHYRRMISTEGVFTRGTLYWQLNDIWQAQTWSSVEWTGQWKVLHYFMRTAYAPILVSGFQTQDRISVYVVLDVIDHEIEYTLEVHVVSWKTGEDVNVMKQKQSNKGFTGIEVFNETMDTVFKGTSPQESFLLFNVVDTKGHTLATNWHFPANFTDVDLPDVKITPSLNSVSENNDTITFELTSSAIAPFVYLESTKYRGVFSDNGFLLGYGANKKEIAFRSYDGPIDLNTFESGLTLRSIKDTYSNAPYQYGVMTRRTPPNRREI